MELKNFQETHNPLFKRKEVKATIEQETTPIEAEVKKSLAEKTKVSEENIKVVWIDGNFGTNTFTVKANVYESKEDLDKTETKSKKQRDAEKKAAEEAAKAEAQAKAEAEKPKESPAEEMPAEENKPEEKTE